MIAPATIRIMAKALRYMAERETFSLINFGRIEAVINDKIRVKKGWVPDMAETKETGPAPMEDIKKTIAT